MKTNMIAILIGISTFSSSFAAEVCGMAVSRSSGGVRDEHSIGLQYTQDVEKAMSLLGINAPHQKEYRFINTDEKSFYNVIGRILSRINPYTMESGYWRKGYDGVELLICFSGEVSSIYENENSIQIKNINTSQIRTWDLSALERK